ncbi:MAG: hypothetical protein K2X11_09550 [Acetobacteraceae bacterium]|nr:hypothetical protein [Acetobacteraceae bacterium]
MSPEQRADAALVAVLETQWRREPVIVLDSPPGAGKTDVAERLAMQSVGLLDERVMVTTQTNEQAFDLMRRLATGFPRFRVYLFAKASLQVPADVTGLPNVAVVSDLALVPPGPAVVVSNAAKWSWVQGAAGPLFALNIVDEAYQLPDYIFQQIAGLAERQALIGDPGQIEPVIQAELERWRCDPAGPHVPAPRALLHRHSSITPLALPVSRRLVQDTVDLVQPAFYPGLQFQALTPQRTLQFTVPGIVPVDTALDAVAGGQSVVMVELPPTIGGDDDPELAAEIVWTVERVLRRRPQITNRAGRLVDVEASMVGVACAQVAQVSAVRERLAEIGLADVFVETANRFQGLERPLMFVHHPLSGRADATAFHLDAGRLCVLLSRHSVGCWVFSRAGVEAQLRRYAPIGDRSLGISDDPEYEGWRANLHLMQTLRARGRIYPVPLRGGILPAA